MGAIFKREFRSYFTTPIGYVVIAAFYFFLGLFFIDLFSYGYPQTSSIIMQMAMIVVLMVPVLTMRIMSEDKRQKVDQVLLTSPVKLTSIVLGKFFAALAVYSIGFIPTIAFEIIFNTYVSISILPFLYSLLGVLLLGCALIAFGMFISSLTESAVISAIITLLINILMLLNISSMITVPEGITFFEKVWSKIVEYFALFLQKITFLNTFNNFGENIFSVPDVIYFISITAVFLFLCVRSLERRRWS